MSDRLRQLLQLTASLMFGTSILFLCYAGIEQAKQTERLERQIKELHTQRVNPS